MRAAPGALAGPAHGDSLDEPTEFRGYAEIVATYGPSGPRRLAGEPALATGDTQMALAVGEGAAGGARRVWDIGDSPAAAESNRAGRVE